MQSRARRFIASTSSSTRVANDLLTAVESPEPAETMEGGGAAAAHEPVGAFKKFVLGWRLACILFCTMPQTLHPGPRLGFELLPG